MAEINAQKTTKALLAYTLSTDRGALVRLLNRNGIELPNNPSDSEITIATLKALKSPSFKDDLAKLLGRKVTAAAADYADFTGIDDYDCFTGIDDFGGIEQPPSFFNVDAAKKAAKATNKAAAKAGRITQTNPQGKTGIGLFLQNLGKSVTSQETINAGLNIGLTAINNKVQAQSNNLNNEANAITQTSDAITNQINPPKTEKSNTLTYIFVGVGVIALLGIVYFVAKKK